MGNCGISVREKNICIYPSVLGSIPNHQQFIKVKMRQEMYIENVKVVELTFEDGTKKLCRGGEEAVLRAWGTYPIVSARWTGEEETMQWIPEELPEGMIMEW
jgi:hypothetical protein